MKDIKDMNLAELAENVRWLEYCVNGCVIEISDRLYELDEQHRWIPVSERMPTEADGDGNGYVEFWNTKYKMPYYYKYDFRPERYGLEITHWKRITPPEEA
jgi:hypothetical protein